MAKKVTPPEASSEESVFPKNLKHYTTLNSLISILSKMELHLNYSDNWEDKNDIASLQAYARHFSVSVKILCFAYGDETIHHWNTYTKGFDGCRIDFNNSTFAKKIQGITGLVYRPMVYVKSPYNMSQYTAKDYPFLKRFPYKCDNEFRILWAGKGEAPVINIDGLISRITLSPHVDDHIAEAICELIRSKYEIKEVYKSRILDYDVWKNLFKERLSPSSP